jgi:hypothetical protein
MPNQALYFFFLWLFNPFIALIYALRNFSKTKVFPWFLISLYFGISFIVSQTGGDSQRYAAELVRYNQSSISFVDLLANLYNEEGGNTDIYQVLVTWLVSLFTDRPKFLFGVFAVVFGYFWYKSIEIIIKASDTVRYKSNLVGLVLIMILLTNPIWSINGVRMWTAVQIFMYGVLCVEVKKDNKGYLWIFSTILVHISLGSILIWYLIYKLLPLKRINILFYAYVISFFFGELNIEVLRTYTDQLPGFLESKKSYVGEEYMEVIGEMDNQAAIHYVLANTFKKYLVLGIVIYMYIKSFLKGKTNNVLFEKLFKLSMFMALFANIAASVPSGGRFLVLTDMLMLSTFVFFLTLNQVKIEYILKNIVSGILVFLIIFQIRTGFDFIGIFYFIGNPIIMLFFDDTTPVIDFVKSIF